MIELGTAIVVAKLCLTCLRLAIPGLKGLFKWIRRWFTRRLDLKKYVDLLDEGGLERQARLVADKLIANPAVMRRAMKFAKRVKQNQISPAPPEVQETPGTYSDYETGSEWGGSSYDGSDVSDSDRDLSGGSDDGRNSDPEFSDNEDDGSAGSENGNGDSDDGSDGSNNESEGSDSGGSGSDDFYGSDEDSDY